MTGVRTTAPAPPARRVAFLDVARALAMIGVVMMNAPAVVLSAEFGSLDAQSTLSQAVDTLATLLMSGKARAMLMILLGAGAVLAWRSAARRGGRPVAVMARRYVLLGLLFGVPHLLVFDGDILTQYAVTAVVLAPLMPVLLGGTRGRPLYAAFALFLLAPVVETFLNLPVPDEVGMLVTLLPQVLGFFCVGVWLARRPELTPEAGDEPSRLPVRMLWVGVAVLLLGAAAAFSGLLFPMELDANGVPVNLGADGVVVRHPAERALMSFSSITMGLGGALFYLGLVWWLVLRDRTASRVLAVLVPLGRMTLTVYLVSTAVFLVAMGPLEGKIPLLAQYGLAVAYFVAALAFAHLWTSRFRLGPLEWAWRSLTYLRPMPMRRRGPVVAAGSAEPRRAAASEAVTDDARDARDGTGVRPGEEAGLLREPTDSGSAPRR